jgi:hypothetical protein
MVVGTFIFFLICIACPPLFVVFPIAAGVLLGRRAARRRYAKERQIRNADIPPRGYPSGQALRNNRRYP